MLLAAACATAGGAGTWTVYEGATLIDHPANDGDSFHVRCGRAHYIFRLYFVDAPETGLSYPERVREQAAYFGVTSREVVELGKSAADFSRAFLGTGFTVYTKKEDARGRSAKPRYFAMIRVNGRDLSAALVEAGLARVYGCQTELPEGRRARAFQADLRVAERGARRAAAGAWKGGAGVPAKK